MIKLFYIFLFLGFITSSCATTEQSQETPVDKQVSEDTENKEQQGPAWYDHSNRSFSDSTTFVGVGLAVASDSSQAHEESMRQAKGNLNYSIDAYAEEIRKNLSEGSNGDQFSSSSFVLSLRNAVRNLQLTDEVLQIDTEYIEQEESVYHVYSRLRIGKDRAVEMLESAINNDTFVRSLQTNSAP